MEKYFLDTEFIEGFSKPVFGKNRHFIDLVSIGIVCEDGREYYAISKDFNPKDASEWVRKNVLGKLEPEDIIRYKTNEEIKQDVASFFDCWRDQHFYRAPEGIEVYGYFADYDWVLFCSLFGTMMDLPKGFPMYCKDLKQMIDDAGLTNNWKKKYCPDPEGEHNALVDAKWNMKLFNAFKEWKKQDK